RRCLHRSWRRCRRRPCCPSRKPKGGRSTGTPGKGTGGTTGGETAGNVAWWVSVRSRAPVGHDRGFPRQVPLSCEGNSPRRSGYAKPGGALRREGRRLLAIQVSPAAFHQILHEATPLLSARLPDAQDSLHESTAPAAIRAAAPLPPQDGVP